MSTEQKFPSEIIQLPSKGYFYPENHPLSKGTIELKYPTAKEEDILASQNLIKKGVVIDHFIKSLIVDDEVKNSFGNLLSGDKNGIIIASRILAYGPETNVNITCPACETMQNVIVDLSNIQSRDIDFDNMDKGSQEFVFHLPLSGVDIKIKLLTHQDEQNINTEVKSLRKIKTKSKKPLTIPGQTEEELENKDVTTRLKYLITEYDGSTEKKVIREKVETIPTRDTQALREFIRSVSPDIDLSYEFECSECDYKEVIVLPLDVRFFWPSR